MTKMSETCPLCQSPNSQLFAQKNVSLTCHHEKTTQLRHYFECQHCLLIFVERTQLPTFEQEKALYDLHDNQPHDEGYRRFLSRMSTAMLKYLPSTAHGLDFGCGPGPALYQLFEEAGLSCENYDPLYAPDASLLAKPFDFICSTEVIEHIHWPRDILTQRWQQIKPGGVFGIMTKRPINYDAFMRWHYTQDPTHVRFYSEATLTWLANTLNARIEFPASDVALLFKPI